MDINRPIQPGISRLAIDVGNVISQRLDTDQNEGDLSTVMASSSDLTPTVECAEACRALVELFGPENTFILSKCKRNMQLATVEFLSRSIDIGANFFERTLLNSRNVIFCTKRSGGVDENVKLRFAPLDKSDTAGPRYAVGDVGKGAVARSLQLTHMIDDRDDCLLSFLFEGHLGHIIFGKRKSKVPCSGGLIHFGVHASIPDINRIQNFIDARGIRFRSKKDEDDAAQACINGWIVAEGWHGVLAHFDIDPQIKGGD